MAAFLSLRATSGGSFKFLARRRASSTSREGGIIKIKIAAGTRRLTFDRVRQADTELRRSANLGGLVDGPAQRLTEEDLEVCDAPLDAVAVHPRAAVFAPYHGS